MGGLLPWGGGGLGWRGVERWLVFLVAGGLAVGVGGRLWERLEIVAGRPRRSAQAGSIAPPALAAALRVRCVERHAARRGDLRLDPRGNGLPDRRRLLAAQLDSGNPPLLLVRWMLDSRANAEVKVLPGLSVSAGGAFGRSSRSLLSIG